MCLIKFSDGFCKTGCNSMTCESVRRHQALANNTPLEIQTAQKAAEICDIYMNNFMRQVSHSLTQTEIDNARHSCIIDVTETGDAQVGIIRTAFFLFIMIDLY